MAAKTPQQPISTVKAVHRPMCITQAAHQPMPTSKRAKQFMPFAALSGLDEALRRKEEEIETEQKLL